MGYCTIVEVEKAPAVFRVDGVEIDSKLTIGSYSHVPY